MKMSLAPRTSAHPSASDRKMVFLAGTYVDGMSLLEMARSFGTETSLITNRQSLNSTGRGIPNVLVQLELDAHWQAVGEHPLGQRARIHDAMNRRQMDRRRTARQVVPRDHLAPVLVVRAIPNDELHL